MLRRLRPAAKQADEQGEQHLEHVVGAARIVDRALAEPAGVHLHVHLVDPEPVRVQHQQGLDLGVVVGVVAGEELDRPPVGHPESRGRVGDLLARDRRQHQREDHVAEPAAERDPVAGVAAEAAAVDHVRLLALGLQDGDHLG
jgi:hypothetical protein